MHRRKRALGGLILTAAASLAAAWGCGDKITIPQPVGLYSLTRYAVEDSFPVTDLRQLSAAQGSLFVLTATQLVMRNTGDSVLYTADGLADATALCVDDERNVVLVWEQGSRRVSWYSVQDLTLVSSTELPAVQRAVAMATSRAGSEQAANATTFLYICDPDSGVVHRYAFSPTSGLSPFGILCRRDGEAAKFVHVPGGLARDSADSLLVCDLDTLRNWVTRFNSVPDSTDTTPAPDDVDPLRGHAALFAEPACDPAPAAAYVLGDAPGCNDPNWVGGRSAEPGAFDEPNAVAVDGSGRIFVCDTRNDRIQVFSATGRYDFLFGSPQWLARPTSLATLDVRIGSGAEDLHYAAYVYVVSGGYVKKLISDEHLAFTIHEPPPTDH